METGADAGATKIRQPPEWTCGVYTEGMISRIYKGARYIDFFTFMKKRIDERTLNKFNFAPAIFDIVRYPVPVIVYKNEAGEIFIDVLYHNTTGIDLVVEKHADITICQVAYPNCLCDLCIRRHLFQGGGRTKNHVKRAVLMGGSVFWVIENERINLKRMLMSVDERFCCLATYNGYPYWLYPQLRCGLSISEPELYHLYWFLGLPDGAFFVNPSIECNSPQSWQEEGVVYLVTPTCQKFKVSGIPSVLVDILLNFDDLDGVWVVVIKDVFKLNICIVYYNGFFYSVEEVFIDEEFFV